MQYRFYTVLFVNQVPPIRPTDRLRLPPLRGKNLDEHFQIVAAEHVGHYVDSAASFAAATLPPMPSKWVFEPGWTMCVIPTMLANGVGR